VYDISTVQSEAIYSRKIKSLSKLRFSDNIAFKDIRKKYI